MLATNPDFSPDDYVELGDVDYAEQWRVATPNDELPSKDCGPRLWARSDLVDGLVMRPERSVARTPPG